MTLIQNHFTYEFDNLHRITEVNVITGAGIVGTTQQTFEYDLMSRIIKTKDISPTGVNEVEHQYNTLNRLLSENLKIGESDIKTTSKEYTKIGRVSKLIYPSGRVNTYTYDDNYLPTTISSNGEVVASYEFNTINAPTKKTLGNQVSLEIEYNTRQQATKHVWKQNGNIISGYHYGYDLVGNRIWSENQVEASKSEYFTFDSADRLTNYEKGILNANQTGTVSPTYFQNWNLDNIGNWQSFNDNGTQSENHFNDVHAMTEFKGTSQIFDANGNLISDGVRSFIYDAFNRLLEVKIGNNIIAQYQYDTYNRRVSKTTNAGTTHYLYDGFRCIEEQSINGILEKEYIHGSLYIDEIISQISSDGTYYFTHDYRYSVTSLTNTTGDTIATYDYKVYGNREGDTSFTDIGYTGQRHDPESGLMYFRNRYYSPESGSFITKDPLGYVDGMSMYLGYFAKQGVDWEGLEAYYQEGGADELLFQLAAEDQNMKPYAKEEDAIKAAKSRPINKGKNIGPVDYLSEGLTVVKGFSPERIAKSKENKIQIYGHSASYNGMLTGIPGFNDLHDRRKTEDSLVQISGFDILGDLSKVVEVSFFNCYIAGQLSKDGKNFVDEFIKKTKAQKVFATATVGKLVWTVYLAGKWSWSSGAASSHRNNIANALKRIGPVAGKYKDKAAFEAVLHAEFNRVKNQTSQSELFTFSSQCNEVYYDVFFENYSGFSHYDKHKKAGGK